jgi:hypothetical protein
MSVGSTEIDNDGKRRLGRRRSGKPAGGPKVGP